MSRTASISHETLPCTLIADELRLRSCLISKRVESSARRPKAIELYKLRRNDHSSTITIRTPNRTIIKFSEVKIVFAVLVLRLYRLTCTKTDERL